MSDLHKYRGILAEDAADGPSDAAPCSRSDTPRTDALFRDWTETIGILNQCRLLAETLERESNCYRKALEDIASVPSCMLDVEVFSIDLRATAEKALSENVRV
jgi:hypothetical protein